MEIGFTARPRGRADGAEPAQRPASALPPTIARLVRTAGVDPDRFLNILTGWTLQWPEIGRLGEQKGVPWLVQAILRYVDTSQGIVGHLDGTLALAGRSVDL